MTIKTQYDEVQIGEQATVCCIKISLYSIFEQDYIVVDKVPVFPYPPHKDSHQIFKFTDLHRHYDYRFWSNNLVEEHLSTLSEVADWPSLIAPEARIIEECDKILTCVRSMPFMHEDYNFLPVLEEIYADQYLVDGKCPHQGFHAFSDRQRGGICKTCPGHGLSFDKNGKVIACSAF